jgi:hypothetical protein
LQILRWLEEYPAVFGLGNLFGRLAYNSSFHWISTYFSLSFLGFGKFLILNGLLLSMLAWKVMRLWFQEDKMPYRLFYFAILASALVIGRSFVSSLSTDLPACFFTFAVFMVFLEELKKGNAPSIDFSFFALFVIACSASIVKLSIAPIGLVILFQCWQLRKIIRKSHIISILAIGCLFFVPWLVRNVILSGYLIYPLGAIDIFDVDWKIMPTL